MGSVTAAGGGGDLGAVSFGSNYSDPKDSAAIAAAIEATGLDVKINTVDHNSYQENFNTYIQQPDDVVCWFAGYRMRAFAGKGVVGDISDVWEGLTDMSEGFKNASTALDGKQYFVPFYFYPWAIHYRKSLFEEKGYEVPTTWDDLLALCEKMTADGITPFSAANDGGWPQIASAAAAVPACRCWRSCSGWQGCGAMCWPAWSRWRTPPRGPVRCSASCLFLAVCASAFR